MTSADQPTPQQQLQQAGIDVAAIRQLVQTGHREDQVRALLRHFGALRRQDLAYLCQVNTTTAGRAVRVFLDQGLVREEQLAPPGHRRTSWLIWHTCTTPTDDQLTGLVHAVPLICQVLYPDAPAEPSAPQTPDRPTVDPPTPTARPAQTMDTGAAAPEGAHPTPDPATPVEADPTPHTQPTAPLPVVTSPPTSAAVPPVAAPVPPDGRVAPTLQRVLRRAGIPRMTPTTTAKQPTPRRGHRPWLRSPAYRWGLFGFAACWLVLLLTQLPLSAWSWPLHVDAPGGNHDVVPPPAQPLPTPVAVATSTTAPTRTGIVTGTGDQGLIVRDAAGARIGHLVEGTVVVIQDDPVTRPDPQHPQWWPIQFHDRTGYISTEYVVLEAILP